ncbi:MAG: hypothetical protein Q9210_000860 [Variospora velana]
MCAQKAARRVPIEESTVMDLLAPLKRIRVPGSVTISIHNNGTREEGDQRPCRKSDCLALAQRVRANIGRLEGEPLSEQEAIWREIKSLHQHDIETSESGVRDHEYYWGIWGDSGIEDVWECLDEPTFDGNGENVNEAFENAVQYFHTQRAESEKKRLERKKTYEEEREAERQAKQKSELQGGKQDEQHVGSFKGISA